MSTNSKDFILFFKIPMY